MSGAVRLYVVCVSSLQKTYVNAHAQGTHVPTQLHGPGWLPHESKAFVSVEYITVFGLAVCFQESNNDAASHTELLFTKASNMLPRVMSFGFSERCSSASCQNFQHKSTRRIVLAALVNDP